MGIQMWMLLSSVRVKYQIVTDSFSSYGSVWRAM